MSVELELPDAPEAATLADAPHTEVDTSEGTPEELLTAAEEEDPLRAADTKRKTHTETRTIEIVPGDNTSDTPFFYGRLRETGELFILRYEDAQGLAGDMLDL